MSGYGFDTAIQMLKRGNKVRRKGWNGKGMWLELQVPDANSKMTLPYIFLSTPNERAEQDGLVDRVPWLASQTDMLAEDWQWLGEELDGLPTGTIMDGLLSLHDVPPTDTAERMHVMEDTCWCEPTVYATDPALHAGCTRKVVHHKPLHVVAVSSEPPAVTQAIASQVDAYRALRENRARAAERNEMNRRMLHGLSPVDSTTEDHPE